MMRRNGVWLKGVSACAAMLLALSAGNLYAQKKRPAPLPPAQPKIPLIFDGRHENGACFSVYYYQERDTKYVMPIQGIKNPPLRTDTRKIVLGGELKCVVAGSLYELKITTFSLTENGVAQKRVRLQGKSVELDLVRSRINVRSGDPANDPDSAFIQLTAAPAERTENNTITGEEEQILWHIFGQQGSKAADVFGRNTLRAKGERWALSSDWIRAIMARRGIRSTAENWDSTATFEGVYPVKNIQTNMVSVHLFSKKIPNYDCKIDIAVNLPVDKERNQGPLQIICDGLEIEQTALPDGQPFCNGAKFFVERRHRSLYTLTPLKN